MAKILVLDDDPQVLELLQQILGDQHTVYGAQGWAEINPYIFGEGIDLFLLDVNMPGLKGDEIAKILREHAQRIGFKVVLFSAADKAELRRIAKQVGADGYIQKTFEPKLLYLRVEKYLP